MSDAYRRQRQLFTNRSRNYQMVAADTSTELNNLIAVRSASYQLFIQRITLKPTTYSAQNIKFQDDANTPVPIGIISVAAAAPTTGGDAGTQLLDYGPEGKALTAGKNLDGIVSAAGIAGALDIECYERPVSGALNANTAP